MPFGFYGTFESTDDFRGLLRQHFSDEITEWQKRLAESYELRKKALALVSEIRNVVDGCRQAEEKLRSEEEARIMEQATTDQERSFRLGEIEAGIAAYNRNLSRWYFPKVRNRVILVRREMEQCLGRRTKTERDEENQLPSATDQEQSWGGLEYTNPSELEELCFILEVLAHSLPDGA